MAHPSLQSQWLSAGNKQLRLFELVCCNATIKVALPLHEHF